MMKRLWLVSICACTVDAEGMATSVGGDEASTEAATGAASSTGSVGDADEGTGSVDDTAATSGGDAPKYDVGTVWSECNVGDAMDAPGTCRAKAPPDSFTPAVQWEWTGPDPFTDSGILPLVANLTDDDGNGSIDLCDVPDVVVVVEDGDPYAGLEGFHGRLYVLDGATGAEHFMVEDIDTTVSPALGDIDGDGLIEIVAARHGDNGGPLVAFEHDGTPKWTSQENTHATMAAIGLADMDNDGDVEIYVERDVFDHDGTKLWSAADFPGSFAATAADLDGDDDLELVLGRSAYHHDGSELYLVSSIGAGIPQIADLDDDPQPEILISSADGLSLLEHDGAVIYAGLQPTGADDWRRPAVVHDFDGDGTAEFAVSASNDFTVYRADATVVWTAQVDDPTGIAGGTAFDFLGDGTAEAMYADHFLLWIYDESGSPLLTMPRTSATLIEYPVVVDVDNDGSAEILVVSNNGWYADPRPPTLRVIRDEQDRWIQARRIWNQHAYHVTNVREDGTIPQFEPPSWQHLNTFRSNAQIEGGLVCDPVPEG